MKRILLTTVAVLGLSSAAFAGMITAPGYSPDHPTVQNHKSQARVTRHDLTVRRADLDDMTTGAIPATGNGYHNGMYETPSSNLHG